MAGCHCISFPLVLVIIGNFNFVSVFFVPAKANPPLVIYADAVLPFAVSGKCFEAVARWYAKFLETCRFVDDTELVESTTL